MTVPETKEIIGEAEKRELRSEERSLTVAFLPHTKLAPGDGSRSFRVASPLDQTPLLTKAAKLPLQALRRDYGCLLSPCMKFSPELEKLALNCFFKKAPGEGIIFPQPFLEPCYFSEL